MKSDPAKKGFSMISFPLDGLQTKSEQEELDCIMRMGSSLSIDQICDQIDSDCQLFGFLHISILEYTLIHESFELEANNCNSSFQTTLDTLYPTSPSDKLYGSDECEIFALTKSFFY
jgi:hypothetical protein